MERARSRERGGAWSDGRKAPRRTRRIGESGRFEIAQRRAHADLPSDIARDLRVTVYTVWHHSYQMGFAEKRCYYDHGSAFTKGSCARLKQATGLANSDLEVEWRLSRRHVKELTRPGNASAGIGKMLGERITGWRDELFHGLSSRRVRGIRRYRLLKTLYPIDQERALIASVLPALRTFFERNPAAGIADVQHWLCEMAEWEKAEKSGSAFHRFLCWTAFHLPKMAAHFDLLTVRGQRPADSLTSDKILAKVYDVELETMRWAVRKTVKPYPPKTVRNMLLEYLAHRPRTNETEPKPKKLSASKKPRRSVGRPSRDIFHRADDLQRSDNWTWSRIAALLDPDTFKHSPEAAKQAIRQGVYRLRQKKRDTPRVRN